ncbi:PP2C family protein-serine/threonine phosphatase [Streptomyces sp. NPDC018693]|uniref:PP2C family protein-serine/threonine phosphatase n=1 Tax=unclassified Streptomyces TaxID=2593676 RepID=UPI00378FA05A
MFGIGRPLRRVLALGLPTVWGAVAITFKLVCPLAQQTSLGARAVTSVVFFAVGTALILHVRQVLLRELRQARRVAGAAQSVLLRPLPPRVDGLNVAAAQVSADRGATVGGDLYEVIAGEHGVRVVMGDVRGHGLPALATVAALLGSFREAAHDEPDLGGVLRRLERAHARHLRQRAGEEHPVTEEFVTVLLLEIARDNGVQVLNCGHPWPYLIHGDRVEPLCPTDPLPPLGLFPLPADLPPTPCGQLLPGESLILYTDGVEDARDARGRYFSLQTALSQAAHQPTRTIPRTVVSALVRHTAGRPKDDMALLALHNDRARQVPSGASVGQAATTRP